MVDDAVPPAPPVPGRSGCLKWTCGCAAVAAVLCLVSVIGVWYMLSGWTRGVSAWENLPPGTVFALEAHDVAALLETAGGDAGALSLMNAALGGYQAFLEKNNIAVEENLPASVYGWSQSLSWIYTTFFPNYVLFGGRGFASEELFLIAQPPRWFAWTAGAGVPEGRVEEIVDDKGNRIFIAFRDGFAMGGLNREIVRHVLDNWGAKAAPLGKKAGRDDAFCMFATRAGDGATARAGQPEETGEGQGGESLLFADPFAAPAEAAGARADAVRFQVLLFAEERGWNIAFEAADAAKPLPPSTFTQYMDADFGAEYPAVVLPDASDAELALRAPPGTVARFNETLEGIPPEFGGDWLRRGVLDRAGGMFALLASRPVYEDAEAAGSGEEPLFPPLPVVSVGWNLGSLQAPAPFANYLGRWADMLPEGAARSLVRVAVSEDRLSGEVSLPPVLVNGARPAWRFFLETVPSMGWLATDPAGLPAENLLPRLAVHALAEPAAGHAALAANWDMSRVFIDGTAAVARDRLSQIPGVGAEHLEFIDFAARLVTAYPGGAVRADINADMGEAVGKARIPFGVGVEIEERLQFTVPPPAQ